MASRSLSEGLPGRLFQAQLAWEAREGRRLTRTELAAMVGESQPTVSEWFSGNRPPSLAQTEALANALAVTASWLGFGQGEPGQTVYPPPKAKQPGKRIR